MQVADDEQFVLHRRVWREHVDVSVEERLLTGKLADVLHAREPPLARRAHRVEALMHRANELEVLLGLRGEGRRVAVPVPLERLQEGVVVLPGQPHLRGFDKSIARAQRLDVDLRDFFRRIEQRHQPDAKLRLRGVHHAVGFDHGVGDGHQLSSTRAIEALEELETP